ncbi:uncharacterized protein LOC122029636 isoform X1 [Zingiber officinale]|uniref:Rad60/SUMO-like domain-containing protein n=1 Tax=Zingiber officinale TaxID=94328 RepID=A0A8J5C3X1_ZINOF|nr:uncharacterized protein LOC122029636 isoform X1 [Zingiber officinale]KAG6472033.1 hypothetical protein ZIOFF_069488 [Zingiber officinale]
MDAAKAALVTVEEEEEDFEPLFNYNRVEPVDLLAFQDDAFDSSPIVTFVERKKASDASVSANKEGNVKGNYGATVVVLDDDEEVDGKGKKGGGRVPPRKPPNSVKGFGEKANNDEDWLPPPPPRVPNPRLKSREEKTLQELRLHKQNLASIAQSVQDVLHHVEEAEIEQHNRSRKPVEQPSKEQILRQKIVISIQDKLGQMQFRVYLDENFDRLFKLYAEKVQVKLDKLVFSFDGEKVSSNATPEALGMENDDIIEVYDKS